MALKKPVVLNSGQFELLQSGDTLDALSSEQGLIVTNANAGAIVIGTPVYITTNDTVDKAKADAVGTVECIGLMQATSTASSSTGFCQTEGILDATTGQWDAVTGGSGGLTAGTIYYVSEATAGMLTSTAPSTTGQFIKQVGIALSTTEMKLQSNRRVKL